MGVEENKAVFKRLIDEIWSKGNAGVLDEVVSPDIVHHFKGGAKNHAEYTSMFEGLAKAGNPAPSIDEMIGEGEKVAFWFTGHDGQHGNWICRFSGGKIVESCNMTSFIRPE